MIDVTAQISLNLVRSADFPHILTVIFSSKRMPTQTSLLLSGYHCNISTVFECTNKTNLAGLFAEHRGFYSSPVILFLNVLFFGKHEGEQS